MSAVSAVAGDLIAEVQRDYPEQAETPAEAQEPSGEPTEASEEVRVPAFNVELPGDVEALLAQEEPEPEYVPQTAEYEDAETENWQTDETEKLRIELHKTQKRAAFLEEQNLKVQRKEWEVEVAKYFPFAEAATIAASASSRREALRRGKEQNEIAERGAKMVADAYEKQINQIVAERIGEVEARGKQAWGEPIGGPGAAPAEAAERSEKLAEIQNARTLQERIHLKIKHGLL